jgi:uncharacterized protein YndB with AHSA1/START domain
MRRQAGIWQMWTDPEHFKAWYGPDGATIPVAKMDVRIGGTCLVCMEMQTPHGPMQMWFTGEYREVVQNERLSTPSPCPTRNGNVISPSDLGMPAGHPSTTEVRVELEDVGSRTKMVMTHAGVRADSPGAAGWAMALDKLAAYVGAHSDRSRRFVDHHGRADHIKLVGLAPVSPSCRLPTISSACRTLAGPPIKPNTIGSRRPE